MVTLQDMALAYLNNVGEQLRQQEEFVAEHTSRLDQLKKHFTECEEKLQEDTSQKLGMIGQSPQITTVNTDEPVTFNPAATDSDEPSVNDQYK